MAIVLQPWQILVAALAGWIARQQDAVIEFLREENRVLKQQLGRRRLRLSDDQRRRLAVRGKAVGRRALADIASLVTPDTILRWHRQLIAEKCTHKRRSSGLPGIMRGSCAGHARVSSVDSTFQWRHRVAQHTAFPRQLLLPRLAPESYVLFLFQN